MSAALLLSLLGALACGDEDRGPECGKVICTPDEYCLSVIGGRPDTGEALPVCTTAPAGCGGTPSCDCLSECTSCEETSEGVYCEIALP